MGCHEPSSAFVNTHFRTLPISMSSFHLGMPTSMPYSQRLVATLALVLHVLEPADHIWNECEDDSGKEDAARPSVIHVAAGERCLCLATCTAVRALDQSR